MAQAATQHGMTPALSLQWFNRPGRLAQIVFLGILVGILALVLRAVLR